MTLNIPLLLVVLFVLKHLPVYDFHHLENKEFQITDIRASAISWNKIVKELRKCVLICANCHRLVHAGMKEIPKDALRFNEKYETYELIRR